MIWLLKLASVVVNAHVLSVYNEHRVADQNAKKVHVAEFEHNALQAVKEIPELSLPPESYPLLQYPTPIYV